jgi:uncharacterized protein YjiS (DUF1127 family)
MHQLDSFVWTPSGRRPLAARLPDLRLALAVMACNWKSRRALAELSDHHLRDIGLSRDEARHEAAKPFWQ